MDGAGRGVYSLLVGITEGKRPMGKTKRRWEDNTKMELKEVECVGIDLIEVTHNRGRWQALVNAVMNLRVP
jgi:hypothetical protein